MTVTTERDGGTRSNDLRIVEDLNRNYLRAAEFADVAWYEAHLADDFLSSSVDGSISDRAAFLKRISRPYPGGHFEAVGVRIRFVGELALVHAGFKYTKPDGQPGTGRYTDVYAQRQGRWLCVSAHFNRF
jgi:ketosteroid isomerase-like protein